MVFCTLPLSFLHLCLTTTLTATPLTVVGDSQAPLAWSLSWGVTATRPLLTPLHHTVRRCSSCLTLHTSAGACTTCHRFYRNTSTFVLGALCTAFTPHLCLLPLIFISFLSLWSSFHYHTLSFPLHLSFSLHACNFLTHLHFFFFFFFYFTASWGGPLCLPSPQGSLPPGHLGRASPAPHSHTSACLCLSQCTLPLPLPHCTSHPLPADTPTASCGLGGWETHCTAHSGEHLHCLGTLPLCTARCTHLQISPLHCSPPHCLRTGHLVSHTCCHTTALPAPPPAHTCTHLFHLGGRQFLWRWRRAGGGACTSLPALHCLHLHLYHLLHSFLIQAKPAAVTTPGGDVTYRKSSDIPARQACTGCAPLSFCTLRMPAQSARLVFLRLRASASAACCASRTLHCAAPALHLLCCRTATHSRTLHLFLHHCRLRTASGHASWNSCWNRLRPALCW